MSTPRQAQLFFPTNLCHVFVNTAALLSQQPHIALTWARHHLATTCRKILNILARIKESNVSRLKSCDIGFRATLPMKLWFRTELSLIMYGRHVWTQIKLIGWHFTQALIGSRRLKTSLLSWTYLWDPFKRETVLYRKRANAGQKTTGIIP